MTWPAAYGRRVFAEVGSTLSEAARLAPQVQGPEWILAHHQTAARGRRGRPWAMAKGNFAATLILPDPGPPQTSALRSFVAAMALNQALIEAGVPATDIALKWPNDVLVQGGKIAGILLETVAGQGSLIIGIGVNLASAPAPDAVEPGAVRPVSVKGCYGLTVAPEDFLDMLARAYARYEDQFRTFGFAPIRTAWLANAARLGEVITARTMRDSWQGTFRDVDLSGQLVLETAKGRHTIPAADIYF